MHPRSRPRRPRALALVCLAWAASCSGADEPRASSGAPSLDVLIVVADDLASKAVGAFGGEWIETPNLDRLAARGFAFERAVCSSPFCTPSRQSFLTGRWPHSIGVTQIGSILPPASTTLGTVFRDAGYRTAAIGKMHWSPKLGGKASYGFDVVTDRSDWEGQLESEERKSYDAYRKLWKRKTREGWSSLNPDREPCPLPENRQLAPYLIDRALAFLSAEDEKPALAFLSFYEPHAPFSFPPRLKDAVDPAALDLPATDPDDVRANAPGLQRAFGTRLSEYGPFDEETMRGAIAAYLSSVLWLDEQIGLLLERLDASGASENTLIVFWSDNGFFLGERGMVGKNYPYREAAEVPLALVGPGIPRGRSAALVQLIDVFPTLCELTGVPAPENLQGTSLAPLLSGADLVRDQAYCEFVGLAAALQTKEWKLMLGAKPNTGWDLLYDLTGDPLESRDVFDDPASREAREHLVQRMHAVLAATPADGIPPEQWMTQADPVEAIRWALLQIDAAAQ